MNLLALRSHWAGTALRQVPAKDTERSSERPWLPRADPTVLGFFQGWWASFLIRITVAHPTHSLTQQALEDNSPCVTSTWVVTFLCLRWPHGSPRTYPQGLLVVTLMIHLHVSESESCPAHPPSLSLCLGSFAPRIHPHLSEFPWPTLDPAAIVPQLAHPPGTPLPPPTPIAMGRSWRTQCPSSHSII